MDFFAPPTYASPLATTTADVLSDSEENLPVFADETPIMENQETMIDFADIITETLNDADKIRLIEKVWKPPCDYKFPHRDETESTKKKVKKTRSCQYSWLEKYDWLVYSKSKDVLFCMPCILFQKQWRKQSALISQGYSYWGSAVSKLKNHGKAENHLSSVQDFHTFVSVSRNPNQSIEFILSKLDVSLIKKNRVRIFTTGVNQL